jgi:hypothetical protein
MVRDHATSTETHAVENIARSQAWPLEEALATEALCARGYTPKGAADAPTFPGALRTTGPTWTLAIPSTNPTLLADRSQGGPRCLLNHRVVNPPEKGSSQGDPLWRIPTRGIGRPSNRSAFNRPPIATAILANTTRLQTPPGRPRVAGAAQVPVLIVVVGSIYRISADLVLWSR